MDTKRMPPDQLFMSTKEISVDCIADPDRWYALPSHGITIWVDVETEKQDGGPIDLATETCDLPARLTFLRMLKEKTVFGEHAILSRITEDYDRALRQQTTDKHNGSKRVLRRHDGNAGRSA